ncbi:MAG: PqqD family protein [Actinomycetota bacterium]|nr:PqqD family protein [Actinomycetota bacterium]
MGDDYNFLKARVRRPEHVVYRSFAAETVVLNLDTGQYHGLNATAGRMLEVLEEVGSVQEAASRIARDYGQPVTEVEEDLCTLCASLADRGLIEVDGDVR